MKATTHLSSAIISLFIFIVALISFDIYSSSLEQKYVNALAPLDLNQTINGIALQYSAFTHPDLLPIYGSSELSMIDTPYDAEQFFATYPTGFTVFQVANLGMASLNYGSRFGRAWSSFTRKEDCCLVLARKFYDRKFLCK